MIEQPAVQTATTAIYRVSGPDGLATQHSGIDAALKAARELMFITQQELDGAEVTLSSGVQRHIFTYGFASTWVERI